MATDGGLTAPYNPVESVVKAVDILIAGHWLGPGAVDPRARGYLIDHLTALVPAVLSDPRVNPRPDPAAARVTACPSCGTTVVRRDEPNGDSYTCVNGHTFAARDSVHNVGRGTPGEDNPFEYRWR